MKQKLKKIMCLALTLAFLTMSFPALSVSAAEVVSDLSEDKLKDTILASLQEHISYAETLYHDYSGKIPGAGYFGTGDSGEDGIRTHNNYLLVYSFLYSENSGKLDRELLKSRIVAGIKYSVNSHKVGNYSCVSNGKWGQVWESSLLTSALAYAGYLMGDELDSDTKEKLKNVIAAEADYNTSRTIPTQVKSDTKAEENGWDTNVLAIAANMYPDDSRAVKWDEKAKAFAMNTLSMNKDMTDETIVDGKKVNEWVIGPNLYDDYSLENHGIFHPVYQMNPILELGDSALYYKMKGNEVPKAFEHNVVDMYNTVLKKIVLATGEWAYPNGCDWSVDLLDHINSIAFMSTYFKDVDAKMLEQRLIQFIRARQLNYTNGSLIGPNSDIGPRRESVQAERLVYTYMFHKYFGPWSGDSTNWKDFVTANSGSAVYTDGDVILNKNKDRFASFSWNSKNMGLIVPDSNNYLDRGFVNFPYQKSLTGTFTVENKAANQVHFEHNNRVEDTQFTTTGLLRENDFSIDHYVSFAALPGNAVVYMDEAKAKADITVTKEEGIPLGFQTDEISGNTRALYSASGSSISDGNSLVAVDGNWVDVDNSLSVVVNGGQGIKYGNRSLSNSVYYSKLYASYSDSAKSFAKGDMIANRTAVFYSNINSDKTANLAGSIVYPEVADGWKAAVVEDVYAEKYLVASNFYGDSTPITITLPEGAPVLSQDTAITGNDASAILDYAEIDTQITSLSSFVKSPEGASLKAVQSERVPGRFFIKNEGKDVAVDISMRSNDGFITKNQKLKSDKSYMVELSGDKIKVRDAQYPDKPVIAKIQAVLGCNGINLSWGTNFNKKAKIRPFSNSGKVTEFIIERRNFGGKWSKIASVNGKQTRFIDTQITNSTTYQYRITASTDDRTASYTSDFIASNPEDDKYGLINLAKGKPVYAPYQQGLYPPSNANDGNQSTFWVSESSYPTVTNSVYFNLDLIKNEPINKIKITPRKNYGPKDIEIQVSSDNVNFTTVASDTLPNSACDMIIPTINTRYIRLKVNSAYDTVSPSRNVQIVEFEVFRCVRNLAAPANLTVQAATFKNNNLTWEDKSKGEDGFVILRYSSKGEFERIGVVGANTTAFYDTKPVPGQQYTYIVSAYNVHGRSYSNEATVTALTSPAGKIANSNIIPEASSSQASYPIAKAFDDNASTFYVSSDVPSSTLPVTINLTLNDTISLDKLTFQPRINGTYYYNPKDIAVYVSTNGTDYSKVKEASIPAGNTVQTVDIGLVSAKYIRMVVTSVNNPGATKNLQCAEIGVYSGVNSFDAVTTSIDRTNLIKGETAQLKVTEGKMSDGSTVDLTNAEFFYTTDDYTVAQVNESGTIKAVSEGTANISVFVKIGDYWTQSSVQISVVR